MNLVRIVFIAVILSLTTQMSLDQNECQEWYQRAWASKPKYIDIFPLYEAKNCKPIDKGPVLSIGLTGIHSNRFCTVYVDRSQVSFKDNLETLDCFKFFDQEIKNLI